MLVNGKSGSHSNIAKDMCSETQFMCLRFTTVKYFILRLPIFTRLKNCEILYNRGFRTEYLIIPVSF